MEKDYADAIKQLVADYYRHEISSSEYRTSRKRLIDQMGQEFNGNEFTNTTETGQAQTD